MPALFGSRGGCGPPRGIGANDRENPAIPRSPVPLFCQVRKNPLLAIGGDQMISDAARSCGEPDGVRARRRP